ncbi:hypothetical protein CMK18_08510 [Candidatus Poribacteria bacterium]|nr:hypothetical protein [Candidatus Poribacteria bacterium]
MAWEKLGFIHSPDGKNGKGRTHATLAVPYHLNDQVYRVLFASRDDQNRSFVWSVDVELSLTKPRVVSRSLEPLLEPGSAGHFDDCGVYPSSLVKYGNTIYLYYIGWVAGAVSPMFYTNVGLAISENNGKSFKRYSLAPVIGRDAIDPWMVTAPFVLNQNEKWRMWYIGGGYWDDSVSPWQSYYQVKYAESDDGIHWKKSDQICIPLHEGEHHISRTCVVPRNEGYESWYGFNAGSGYRIGYASSNDGLTWKRNDSESGIKLSVEGWDSKSQSYPYIIDMDLGRFMFYNGNDFGRTGFGLAVWK